MMLTLTSPVRTYAHDIPAGAKIAALCLITLGLFALTTPLPLALAAGAMAGLALSCGLRFATALLRALRVLWPFLLILALWHLWTGEIGSGLTIALRMLTAVAAATFVTMTTPLSAMLDLFARLASPLQRLGLSPKALSLALALMIRFIPVMLDRFAALSMAWRARAVRRLGWQVLMPATLAALDDAAHVAEALRARGGAE